ncbi:putative oxidoreductase [Massarina eburnea CBS 473.64]|uniref:Putative oxidoreductase n=1 Tax=Massarina eburnea CBS 473.64 TaxID=1395130 RepID=A0A6A6SJI4_9PLEO|nr:putative oxidoreductase [Massarina eburnea CBS 473.64]
MAPQLIFGTATFGMAAAFNNPEDVKSLLTALKSLNINHLDTAARYPPTNPWKSEELIGEAEELSRSFVVDTKCYTDTATNGSGDLEKDKMEESVGKSLGLLHRKSVHVLYAHRADPSTPLEVQIRNFNEQITKGRCEAWGVSNFTPSAMKKLLQICDEKGLEKPKYYQGAYNAITRAVEAKLLPLLRIHGIAFTGYVPLAGGFLTGNLVNNNTAGTRFDERGPMGKILKTRFDNAVLASAMMKFDTAVKEKGLLPAEVSLRWLVHHSALTDQDGIILGASRVEQVMGNVNLIEKGNLDEDVVALVEQLWKNAEGAHCELIWGNSMEG